MNDQSTTFPANRLSAAGAGQRVVPALLLIATGLAFLLAQTGVIDWGSPWWVIYIAIPSLAAVVAGAGASQRAGTVTATATGQLIVGGIGLLLSIIFVFDPTWSFTRGVGIFFPWLSWISWDLMWPIAIVLLGVGVLLAPRPRRASPPAS